MSSYDPCYEIRLATVRDIDLISKLANQIWPDAFASILRPKQIRNLVQRIYNPESLKNEIENLDHVFWIISFDSEAVGFASAYTDKQTIWLKKLYIRPDVQGKGLGSALIKTIVSYFPGFKNISLFVNRDNISAQEFYKRKGFLITDEQAVKMGDFDFIDLVMSKTLH